MQGVSKTDFENYVKANDAVLWNMQNQGQGTLPSQTVTNPREHVNAITTRSGKTYEGPRHLCSESTAQVPPPEDHDSIFIEIPKPKAKKTVQEPNSPKPNSYQPKLPYPERMKVREKDKPSAQQSRFMKLFKQLQKLEDPGKFLIPCALQELDRKNALANSGASINLFPHSIGKQLRLGALKPTPKRHCGSCSTVPLCILWHSRGYEPFSGSTTNHSDALPPSSSPVKTSDNPEEFADELTLLKKVVHEENFQVYSNPLFEFDDNFNSSNVNPLFNEMDEEYENENSNVLQIPRARFYLTQNNENTFCRISVECSDQKSIFDENSMLFPHISYRLTKASKILYQGPTNGIRANIGTLRKKGIHIEPQQTPLLQILNQNDSPANDEFFTQHLSDDEASTMKIHSDTTIRTRFGGNANSKKMQKAVLKQQFKRDLFYQDQGAGKKEQKHNCLLIMGDGVVNWGEHTVREESTNHGTSRQTD
ncbi:hypothetical protein Tco_0001650 [Tanacetum coccineum]